MLRNPHHPLDINLWTSGTLPHVATLKLCRTYSEIRYGEILGVVVECWVYQIFKAFDSLDHQDDIMPLRMGSDLLSRQLDSKVREAVWWQCDMIRGNRFTLWKTHVAMDTHHVYS